MNPKEFIRNVLISEIKDILNHHPYLSFALIAIGIEFIGKCMLTEYQDWNKIKPDKAFKKGYDMLIKVDMRYKNIDLKDELRNGFAHTFSPKSKIVLSEVKHGAKNFNQNSQGRIILVAEEFYRDFVLICHEVLKTEFDDKDKMNKGFLRIGD